MKPRMASLRRQQCGVTLVELLVTVTFGAILLLGFQQLFSTALTVNDAQREDADLARQARFAMSRIVETVRSSQVLLVPAQDRSSTNWPENIREQTVPASPPVGDSALATAVLAVSMPASWDIDQDGIADADNDRDGRVDEDWPADITNDGEPGVQLVDDNGDGRIDDGLFATADDDEHLSFSNEDPVNGIDDDGDGSIDEDPPGDMNNDSAPGVAGVDDDGDGAIDEGDDRDDDEDGQRDEDWLDPVVFAMQGATLIERRAVPWDSNSDGSVTGADFVESVLAENLTLFRVEATVAGSGDLLVDVTLTLTGASGSQVSLQRQVRVGSLP